MGAIADILPFAPFPTPLPLQAAPQDLAASRALFNALIEYINTIIYGDNAASIALLKAQNLADLNSVPTARANLGLGSAALQPSSAFDAAGAAAAVLATSLQKAQNLADLVNAGMARTNLGLGSAATMSSTAFDPAGAAAARAAKGINSDITALTALKIVAKTANYAVQVGDQTIECDASGGAFTITYTPGTAAGRVSVIKTDNTYNPVNISDGTNVIASLVSPAVSGYCQSMVAYTNGSSLRVS